jgi:hypothetical protein
MNEDVCGGRTPVQPDKEPMSLRSLTHLAACLASTDVIRRSQCAVKGVGPQREINPPGNWIAPPGSNRSGGGGNKAAGAAGVEGRIRRLGESAGCNASER